MEFHQNCCIIVLLVQRGYLPSLFLGSLGPGWFGLPFLAWSAGLNLGPVPVHRPALPISALFWSVFGIIYAAPVGNRPFVFTVATFPVQNVLYRCHAKGFYSSIHAFNPLVTVESVRMQPMDSCFSLHSGFSQTGISCRRKILQKGHR